MLLLQVGWVLGPDHIMKHLRTVHQNSIFHCPTQSQVKRAGDAMGEQGDNERAQAGPRVREQLICLGVCLPCLGRSSREL